MRWRQRYNYVRPARPKARSLTADEADQIPASLKVAIDRSPILKAFGVQARSSRSRFYLEWRFDPVDLPEEISSYGRITPLENPPGDLLLEAPYGRDKWSRVGTGSPEKLIQLVAGDTEGTFHGLGALDKSLVRFTAVSWSGETFGRTCLYLKREERWGAYIIRPNQSHDIAAAETWLVKRKWVPWG